MEWTLIESYGASLLRPHRKLCWSTAGAVPTNINSLPKRGADPGCEDPLRSLVQSTGWKGSAALWGLTVLWRGVAQWGWGTHHAPADGASLGMEGIQLWRESGISLVKNASACNKKRWPSQHNAPLKNNSFLCNTTICVTISHDDTDAPPTIWKHLFTDRKGYKKNCSSASLWFPINGTMPRRLSNHMRTIKAIPRLWTSQVVQNWSPTLYDQLCDPGRTEEVTWSSNNRTKSINENTPKLSMIWLGWEVNRFSPGDGRQDFLAGRALMQAACMTKLVCWAARSSRARKSLRAKNSQALIRDLSPFTAQPWASYLTSLCLSFTICRTGLTLAWPADRPIQRLN